jgi:type IV pilus assembly protein PilY1
MKPYSEIRAIAWPLLRGLAQITAAMALALPLPAQSAAVELATVPMATSTVTAVKPNLMFVLDDSGSMAWDYMPDKAKDFVGTDLIGKYGFNSSQCNGVYYNPAITYLPPVNSTGAPLNATPTSFTVAYNDGYLKGAALTAAANITNLSTEFSGGSGAGNPAPQFLKLGPAFYYTYSGNQTTEAKRNFLNSASDFYKECDSAVGSTTVIDGAAVKTRFSKIRLATTPTTTITVSGGGVTGGANFTITSGSGTKAKVNGVKVGGQEIMSGVAGGSKKDNTNTIAAQVAAKINACTTATTGNCQVTGFSASVSGSTVTIVGPAVSPTVPVVSTTSSVTINTPTAFPASANTTVSSITVGGTQLLSAATTTGSTPSALATSIKNNISATGYTATVAGNVVTITGPASASLLTPVITVTSGTLTLTTDSFPESTPAKLQNFANWYSYYSNRMLMMKTGAGLAFSTVGDKYRVGFLSMNNNVSPGIVEVNTFDANQKTAWYDKLYASIPNFGTPLREALSKVGQYYAHKFGTVTTYKATITVGGSGESNVDSIKVNGIEIMDDASVPSTSTSAVAQSIADQINAMQVTDFGAQASNNVITITGPATAAGKTPVVSTDDTMTFTPTAFTASTVTNQLNGIVPADPMQYSCQQNFTILSTDGYWTGTAAVPNLSGGTIGQQDGSAARPFNDGAQANTTYTYTYTRNTYTKITSTCGSGKKLQTQPQTGTCTSGSPTGGCTPTTWVNGTATLGATCDGTTAPSPTAPVQQGAPVATIGTLGGVSDTLADVAMYYYQTDLRSPALGNCTGALGTSVCENNVFTSGSDSNVQQHMTTFTLGLGARGRMIYSPGYLTDTTGDFVAVKLGSTASSTVCTWQTAGTVCNWPTPSSGAVENIDDLWHAAVNGRGAFFSATDPTSLANGLGNALTSISSKLGAAAAAATSTLNPVSGNNFAYVASYTTLKWNGNLEARGINTDTGVVSQNATWCVESIVAESCAAPGTILPDSSGDTTAYFCVTPNSTVCAGGELVGTDCKVPVATACTGTMNAKIASNGAGDSRNIYTANSTGTALVAFDTTYRAANAGYFDATKLSGLSQWPPSADISATANAYRTAAVGDNLLKYLRGQWNHEYDRVGVAVADQLYRNRERVLGDALESQPTYMGPPVFSYPYSGYSEFKAANASRAGNVYMGANDGMMHAFAADTGIERWAYIPSMVIPNLWRLADKQYDSKHTNYINGSAVVSDVCTANCGNVYSTLTPGSNPVWKTILVAGLNGGGRGYYALDVTNPVSPILLWEFTTSVGIGSTKDDALGYTYGQPVITQKADGTWVVVVTSGYDNGTDSPQKSGTSFIPNSPAGNGRGYLYVLNAGTGAIISKIDTGVGTAAAPSGLAKIAGYNLEPTGNKAGFFYGGDLLGNLWRFDINNSAPATIGTGSAFLLATLFSDTAAANPQPIMTTPQLGKILGKRVVFIGTGKYLEVSDLSTTQVQTQYAIKDDEATSTLVNPRTSTTMVQQFLINNPDGSATRVSSGAGNALTAGNAVDFSSGNGWFVDFPESRERVNIDAKLVQGTLLVPSIVPSSTDCSPGGSGWLNFFNYQTGGAVLGNTAVTSSKYDSPIVGLNILYIDGKPVTEVVTSTDPTPQINDKAKYNLSSTGVFQGKRTLWRELIP